MAHPPGVPTVAIAGIDRWLNDSEPDIPAATAELNRLRALRDQVRLAEAHVESYVRARLNLSDDEDDPPELQDTRSLDDE